MKKILFPIGLIFLGHVLPAQNQLNIPPAVSGTTFNLDIRNGVTQFYPGTNTSTYGINGDLLAPTLILNKWDWVKMNVTNNLTGPGNFTTIHWHGLHVPAMADGGPHQVIDQGTTWSPEFQILNPAGTYWYHPHGHTKTELQVSLGIAGMIIVKDSIESALSLPRTYGVDDFPIIVQSKAFNASHQIAIKTSLDTAICVNGTIHPFLAAPAQVIRLRLLNGSSMRTYNFGFSGNQSFKLIATDGGLVDNPVSLTRIRLSPGERVEVLLDLQGKTGQTIYLRSFGSEMPNGIYGAKNVTGMMGNTIPDYGLNPLNGADFNILQINVVEPTSNAITTIPAALTINIPWSGYTMSRTFTLRPDFMMSGFVNGPFNINGAKFDINDINVTVNLNTIEKWRVTNNTGIAHPFHMHDMPFYLLNVNGGSVPVYERGKKDVVLVLPGQYVEFITRFEDFADPNVPYMYHCHLHPHEDDGMMGSFRVIDPTTAIQEANGINGIFSISPNPANDLLLIHFENPIPDNVKISVTDIAGKPVQVWTTSSTSNLLQMNTTGWSSGLYIITLESGSLIESQKLLVQHQ